MKNKKEIEKTLIQVIEGLFWFFLATISYTMSLMVASNWIEPSKNIIKTMLLSGLFVQILLYGYFYFKVFEEKKQ